MDGIDANLSVSTPRYRLKRGAQRDEATREQIETGDGFGKATSETEEVNSGAVTGVSCDLLGEIAGKARITRASAAAILAGIRPDRFALFRVNPRSSS